MRIIHIISSNGLFGAEKVLLNLAKNMNNFNIESWIIGIKNTHNPHLEIIEEAKRNNIPAEVIESKGRLDFNAISQLNKIIKKNHIDLIHTHNYKSTFLGFLPAKKNRIPIITTFHRIYGVGYFDLKLGLYEFLERIIIKLFIGKIIAVSEQVKMSLIKCGFPESKIEAIYNGITTNNENQSYINLRERFGIQENSIIVGIVGRLSLEKGHKYLFEAAKKVIRQRNDIKLLVIGEGPLKEYLKKETHRLGISNMVIFTGYLNEISQAYQIIDILVQPSLREGLPLTILEAMIHRKAIVATNVGGVGQVIKDNLTGILINTKSSNELADAIIKLANDKSLRNDLGNNAREFVMENYSLEKMVNSYRNLYLEVTGLAK